MRTTFKLKNIRTVILETREKNADFGSSLLLANSPMSPKIVNGSFAAIFENSDVLREFARKFTQLRVGVDAKDSPGTTAPKSLNFFTEIF
jgi:histidine decarboxylase